MDTQSERLLNEFLGFGKKTCPDGTHKDDETGKCVPIKAPKKKEPPWIPRSQSKARQQYLGADSRVHLGVLVAEGLKLLSLDEGFMDSITGSVGSLGAGLAKLAEVAPKLAEAAGLKGAQAGRFAALLRTANEDYRAFLDETGYAPRSMKWKPEGWVLALPSGADNQEDVAEMLELFDNAMAYMEKKLVSAEPDQKPHAQELSAHKAIQQARAMVR